MSIMLRPHHALCIRFFIGKGYSRDFTDNMTRVISMLNEEDPAVTLTKDCDIICACCPENIMGICRSNEKVSGFDSRCLKILELDFGDQIRCSRLKNLSYEKVILSGRLREICGSCCWSDICSQLE